MLNQKVDEVITIEPCCSPPIPAEAVFCEHYEELRLELETLYGNQFGSAEPKLTMNDVASLVVHCLV